MSIIKLYKSKSANKKLSMVVALIWIFSSTLLISGAAYFIYFYYRHVQAEKKADSRYDLIAIVQSTQSKEALQTEYIAEQLGLSVDSPTNLYSFDRKKGEQQLLRSPLIKNASIRKISPGTLYVEYSIRIPIAYLGDFTNTAIDENGVLIPFRPFFTPKSLPIILFGGSFFKSWDKDGYWGHSIHGDEFSLAKNIIRLFEEKNYGSLDFIDLKGVKSSNLGAREIVLTVHDSKKRFLRLPADNPIESLENYQLLHTSLFQKAAMNPEIIDLRLNHQALVK